MRDTAKIRDAIRFFDEPERYPLGFRDSRKFQGRSYAILSTLLNG